MDYTGIAPFHDSFSNFKRKIGEKTLKIVLRDLVLQLVEKRIIILKKVAIDATSLTVDPRDTEGEWGYNQEGYFYVYEVYIACCVRSELPVSLTVTPGNVHDSTQYLPLMEEARKCKKNLVHDGRYSL